MTDGVFRPGNGFLYRLDPRIKLVLLVALIVCLFSADTLLRPLLICAVWLLLAASAGRGLADLWKIGRMLRWLLLFTLILHLFFTPGKTLFGLVWLSYDGLMRGLLIDIQLLMAVAFSLLMSWTTPPEALTRGLESLLAPLKLVRVPVREVTALLLLVLHFIPLIKGVVAEEKVALNGTSMKGLSALRLWALRLEPILIRLFDRADQLALDIASGRQQVDSADETVLKKWALML